MKVSKHERTRRALETERSRQIEQAWAAGIEPDDAASFARQVEAARARGPLPPQPDMAPGTPPHPPRPGHEPKPPKNQARPRRRQY
ncbi:MAG: hypothetical protein H6Q36_1196 [Chloroflexi bacterium]|nr:hypothetical protein [Chloroflexota bacterium]